MTLILFLLILGVTVFIHEFGHFIFAKKAGIYVYEFSLGMGPRLFKFKRKNDETEYSLRLFPIGGYVQMAGEEVEADKNIPKEKRMQSKTWLQRLLTIVAGVIFNFILGFVLLFVYALIDGATTNNTYIGAIGENSAAETTNLKVGDLITKLNGKKATNQDIFLINFAVAIENGEPITLEVKHKDGIKEVVTINPIKTIEEEKEVFTYGLGFAAENEQGFLASLGYAFRKGTNLIVQMGYTIAYLITGKLSLTNLSGPIGIYEVVGETAARGLINVIYLAALISINVGFINLLPIPAFDGGRLLFLIIEKIKGKPVNQKVENTIHSIFFILLMILMVAITYNDILKLILKR